MKTAVICFTRSGYELGRVIADGLNSFGDRCEFYYKSRHMSAPEAVRVTENLTSWTGTMFASCEAIIFIGACGIAVRSIAPYVQDKKKDPAVVVLDEQGQFCISLLSGHLGSANELTASVAQMVQAQPVITTATDLNRRFAVDVFARRNGCSISDMKIAKDISAVILQGQKVGFFCDLPIDGEIPPQLQLWEDRVRTMDYGIAVSPYKKALSNKKRCICKNTLYLIPKVITLGIGCRRGCTMNRIQDAVDTVIGKLNLDTAAISQISSIDVKKEEPGLLEFCEKMHLPFHTYSAGELNEVPGEFAASSFVMDQVGVDNVCERSAVLASGYGEIIQKKYSMDGVTVAAAMEKRRISFE